MQGMRDLRKDNSRRELLLSKLQALRMLQLRLEATTFPWRHSNACLPSLRKRDDMTPAHALRIESHSVTS